MGIKSSSGKKKKGKKKKLSAVEKQLVSAYQLHKHWGGGGGRDAPWV